MIEEIIIDYMKKKFNNSPSETCSTLLSPNSKELHELTDKIKLLKKIKTFSGKIFFQEFYCETVNDNFLQ